MFKQPSIGVRKRRDGKRLFAAGKAMIAFTRNELLSEAEVERLARVKAIAEIAVPALTH